MKMALLLEGDLNLRRDLTSRLLGMNFEVDDAADCGSALRRCEHVSYDIVVADVDLPILDGLTFLHRLRIRNPTIPVVALSSYPLMRELTLANSCGAEDFLEKPGETGMLGERVSRLVPSFTAAL